MSGTKYYRARLRAKGQITVLGEVRNILGAEGGDKLVFRIDENGRVIVERGQCISSPDQAWFWSERWQRMEREVQQDIEKNEIHAFNSDEETICFLRQVIR